MDLALVRAWVLALTLAATGAGAEAPPDEVQRLLGAVNLEKPRCARPPVWPPIC